MDFRASGIVVATRDTRRVLRIGETLQQCDGSRLEGTGVFAWRTANPDRWLARVNDGVAERVKTYRAQLFLERHGPVGTMEVITPSNRPLIL